jgi:PKD repeat protein
MERGTRRSTSTALIIGFSATWLSVALIGCGGSSSELGGGSPLPAGTIGVAGGQVSSADGRATLTVPANALTADTVFTIALANGAPASSRIVGPVVDVEPTGTTFPASTPAHLTLAYDFLPGGVDAATLRLGTLVNGAWVTVTDSATDTVIDAANQTVTAPISHLSLYAVLQPPIIPTPSTPPSTNQPPTASAGQQYVGTVNQMLTLSAAGSTDPDGDTLTYTWNFGDQTATTTTASQTVTHVYSAAGTYHATLTVTDGHGGTATAAADVTISIPPPGNQFPIANAGGPYSGTVGQLLTFDGTGSTDPDGDPLTYVWDFGDLTSETVAKPNHAYSTVGTFHVTLTVSDARGGTTTATVDAVIAAAPPVNQPPTASATIPATGLVSQLIAFTGIGTDPNNDPLTYSWAFGDGATTTPSPTAAANHTYGVAGTFTVTLPVSAGRGGFATASGTVVITTPTVPTAVSQQYTINRRQSTPQYYWRYAITLNGTGVPPLTFRIVSFPTQLAADVYNGNVPSGMDMIVNTLYQWWDPATTSWRGECIAADPSCYATASSHVDLTPDPVTGLPNGTVTVNPATSPVTVIYTPVLCWAWSGPPTDSFTFVVTDATGATSEPATISIVVSTNTTCHAPSF